MDNTRSLENNRSITGRAFMRIRDITGRFRKYRPEKTGDKGTVTISFSAGLQIVTRRGLPGTLGCVAWSRDIHKPVFLTNYHVIFGKETTANEDIWLVTKSEAEPGVH